MKTTISFENEEHENDFEMLLLIKRKDVHRALYDTYHAIRQRVKHCDISEEEEKFLEELMETIWPELLDF